MIGNKHASKWLGAHQRLNRLAIKALKGYVLIHNEPIAARKLLSKFPRLKLIQHFEGINGPDGTKFKSPGKEELSHYYEPYGKGPAPILKLIRRHSEELKKALKSQNEERAAFEASWLAHAIVDGLTPAHHYPYEQELEHLRGPNSTPRNTAAKRLVIRGEGVRDTLKKNWRFLGAKGLLSTHMNFEGGVASSLLPLRLRFATPSALEVAYAREHGLLETFRVTARAIADLNLYERFYKDGWTVTIARDVKGLLLPQIAKTVTLAWLLALDI